MPTSLGNRRDLMYVCTYTFINILLRRSHAKITIKFLAGILLSSVLLLGSAGSFITESSESEESSSSSEEDDASLDSRDIGPIRLDPNVCPEGCDPEVFEKTYELRNTRHKHEQEMIEQNHLVELLRKDIDAHNKVKRKLSVQLDQRKNQLREFMLEKQNCLNEVDQVIVLRYDQIRAAAIYGCTSAQGLSKTIVFPERTLMKLRNRVLELQDEINQQKKRQKVNRTHLFRMNIDLRAMADQAEELRAQMRDVLTRKLGKPRRVDKTLDDLLRLMARRHKFGATLGAIPQMLQQLREWRDRYSELEKKYMQMLNQNSNRLRLAAAMQADVLPNKTYVASDIVGPYDAEVYYRDVVRLRIVRSQQLKQIKAIREEILALKLKPMSPRAPMPSSSPPAEVRDQINLFMPPRVPWRPAKKYFPTTPLGSTVHVHDVNIMKLLYDCLDSMRVTRDDAELLLRDLTDQLHLVLTGAKSRYDIVDEMVKRWVVKYGGDPAMYKKQTRAFDALGALAERLLREHMETMEGPGPDEVVGNLESALKDIAGEKQPLHKRLGPALAALCLTTEPVDLETIETMVSLVKSLVDEDHVLTRESIDNIEIFDVVEDLKAPDKDIEAIVIMAIECLKAQLTTDEENKTLRDEVEKEFEYGRKSLKATFTMPPSSLAGTISTHSMKSRRSLASVHTESSKVSGDGPSVSSRTGKSDPSGSTPGPKEQGDAHESPDS